MNDKIIAIDGKIPARNMLILLDKGGKDPKLNISYVNCMPVKVGEFSMITPDQVLSFKDGEYVFKEGIDEDVREFYNTQLTNHLNDYLYMLVDGWIDDYRADIKDVIEASKTDETTKDALMRFNNDVAKMLTAFENEDYLSEVEELLPSDAITMVYPRNASTSYIYANEVPVNKYLEEGKVLSVSGANPDPSVRELFHRFNSDIGNGNAIRVYMDDMDNDYFVLRKNGFYYIRKRPVETFFRLSKSIPV